MDGLKVDPVQWAILVCVGTAIFQYGKMNGRVDELARAIDRIERAIGTKGGRS